ncbi:VOC family protein [Oerskovia flava]|uniref:VOC family protein n=1 Tax=Oerskovia flava TaxID=2986422 RepID=UPI00223FF618|nr:glyoxalase superfamily protein [Oerskovia sp. JB1-3-2]
MFRSIFPILTTTDIGRALAFYRDLLRGRVEYSYPPDGPPAYAAVRIGHSTLGIAHESEHGTHASGHHVAPHGGPVTLWIYVDDCDHAVEQLAAAGVTIVAPAEDQPWGERMARVLDPDGNEILLGQEGTSGTEEPQGPTGLS